MQSTQLGVFVRSAVFGVVMTALLVAGTDEGSKWFDQALGFSFQGVEQTTAADSQAVTILPDQRKLVSQSHRHSDETGNVDQASELTTADIQFDMDQLFSHQYQTAFQPAVLDTQLSFSRRQLKLQVPVDGQSIAVPFNSSKKAIMLSTKIDGHEPATFILDSGATYTSISRSLAIELGYDLDSAPKVRITTANGRVTIPKITLESLTLNGYTVHNVEATVMDLPESIPFKGLLGLNFIKRQRVTIDAASSQLILQANA